MWDKENDPTGSVRSSCSVRYKVVLVTGEALSHRPPGTPAATAFSVYGKANRNAKGATALVAPFDVHSLKEMPY